MYSVPNTVVILIGDHLLTAYGPMTKEAKKLETNLKGKGYYVKSIDVWWSYKSNLKEKEADIRGKVNSQLDNMWGFAYFGHGTAGFSNPSRAHKMRNKLDSGSRLGRGYAGFINSGPPLPFMNRAEATIGPNDITPFRRGLISVLACFSAEGAKGDNWSDAVSKYGKLYTVKGMDFAPRGVLNFEGVSSDDDYYNNLAPGQFGAEPVPQPAISWNFNFFK